MSWQHDIRRTTPAALLAFAAFVAVAPATASAISFSGLDAQSQYTGFASPPGIETPGLFTFDDTMNGTNPNAEPGVVTGSNGVAGVLGGVIDLQLLLDTSGFDPATDNLQGATFGGTGGGEVLVWDSTKTTVLLAFDVSFVQVASVSGTNNLFQMGDPEGSATSGFSLLTVSGGSLAGSVGGAGMPALLHLIVNDPDPPLPTTFPERFTAPGYLDESFNSGFAGAGTANAGVNWAITIVPEPGTAGLVALGLLALGLRGRRQRA